MKQPIKIINMVFSSNNEFAAIHRIHGYLSHLGVHKNYKMINIFLTGKKNNLDEVYGEKIFWRIEPRIIRQKGFFNRLKYRFYLVSMCYQLILKQKPDLILCDGLSVIKLISQIQKKIAIKGIGIFHGNTKLKKQIVNNLLHQQNLWKFVAVSNCLFDEIRDNFKSFRSNPLHAISNVIDKKTIVAQLLPPKKAKTELGLNKNGCILGTIGRMSSEKSHIHLINAVYIMKNKGIWPLKAQLCIIGDGPLYKTIKNQVEELNLNNEVVLPGFKKNAAQFLSSFDVFLMSSYEEGLSIAVLEAAACSLPLILSDIGTFKTLGLDSSYYYSLNHSARLVSLLKQTLNLTSDQLKKRGQHVHERLQHFFDVNYFQNLYDKIIIELTNKEH